MTHGKDSMEIHGIPWKFSSFFMENTDTMENLEMGKITSECFDIWYFTLL